MNGNEYRKLVKEGNCTICGVQMTVKNTIGRFFKESNIKRCGKCYLEWKRMERKKNAET